MTRQWTPEALVLFAALRTAPRAAPPARMQRRRQLLGARRPAQHGHKPGTGHPLHRLPWQPAFPARAPARPIPQAVTMIATTAPTPQRHQHDRVTRDAETLADTAGAIGLPFRVESLLGRLERHGDITAGQRHAGEEFGRLFRLAHLDPVRAADLLREERSRLVSDGARL